MKLLALLAAATAAAAAALTASKVSTTLVYPLNTTSVPLVFYWQNNPIEPVGEIDVHLSISPDLDLTVNPKEAIATVRWQESIESPAIESITTEPIDANKLSSIWLRLNVAPARFSTPFRYTTTPSSVGWAVYAQRGPKYLSLIFESYRGQGLAVRSNANPQTFPEPIFPFPFPPANPSTST